MFEVAACTYDRAGNWFLDWIILRASGKDILLVYFIVFISFSLFNSRQSLESAGCVA